MPTVTHVRGPVIPGSAQRLFLACPTTEKFNPPFVASLFDAVSALAAAGIQADLCTEVGNCHVDDARNSLVRQFLLSDCTDLVFIDADVGFRASDLVKLARYDRDVVAGVYPKKQDDEEFPVACAPGVELWAEPDGCVVKGIVGLPTGFMRVRRHVLETMVEAFKPRSFAGAGSKPGDPLYTIIFEREIHAGKRYSGDYNFCRRWVALGGELAVDPHMAFVHEGSKQWVGDLASYWRRAHGVTAQAFDGAVEALRHGDPAPEDFMALCQGWDNVSYQGDPLLVHAAYLLAKKTNGPILEAGSGLTTLAMALARTDVQIFALEHDKAWAAKTRDALTRAGVADRVSLLHAPLVDHVGLGRWYAIDALPAHRWTLVVNDGPPRTKGDRGVLYSLLGDAIANATILCDDTEDPAQLAPLKAWAEQRGRVVRNCEDGDRGAAVCPPPEQSQEAA